jgi:hypothetical protein
VNINGALCLEPTRWVLTNKEKIKDLQVVKDVLVYFQNLHFPGSLNVPTPGIVRRTHFTLEDSSVLKLPTLHAVHPVFENITGLSCCFAQKLSSCMGARETRQSLVKLENGGE